MLSLYNLTYVRSVQPIRPLNSHTLLRTTYLSLLAFNFLPSLHIHTTPLFHVKPEKDGWQYVDVVWYQGAQNIGLSNYELKSR